MAPVAAAQGLGFVTLDSAPWSRVAIDGVPAGSTPIFKARLPAGRHSIVFTAESGARATRDVDVKPGAVVKLQVDLK